MQIKKLTIHETYYDPDHGRINIVKDDCALCGKVKVCIEMDNSDGEYYSLAVCRDCVNKQINEVNK